MKVSHVAKLANLPLTEAEEEKYSQQLSKILEYVDQLNSVRILQVDPIFNVTGQENVMAEDKIGVCWTQDEAVSNASKKQDGFFVTKGVFNNE